MVDEGLVDLDDTIDEWVDGIPRGDEVTLGQLAEMTAGVPDYTGEAFIAEFTADPGAAFERQDLLDHVREGEPTAPPGEERIYINSSTVLLGEVVEQVSGADLAEELERRILRPLGLDDTTYHDAPADWGGPHATGYQPDDGELVAADQNFTVFDAAGAMTSTATDLAEWGRALARGDLLAEATHEERLDGSPLVSGPEYDSYASGIGEIDRWWGHTGEGFGFTALVMHDPDTGSTVTIFMNLSNAERHPPTVLFRRIAEILGS